MKTTSLCVAALLAVQATQAGMFQIGGLTFDDANAVRTAQIVEGPVNLRDYSNRRFGKYSESYIRSIDAQLNDFRDFSRSRSIARLMGRGTGSDSARHITLPEMTDRMPMPNVHRSTIELTWGDSGLRNLPGPDFVIFESGVWEGLAVSVRKVGSNEFTPFRYQFSAGFDEVHNVNTAVYDLSKFGLADGDVINAVRIRNVFNSQARMGSDRVDDASGEGWVIYPGNPKYKSAHKLLDAPGGREFSIDRLGADLVYAVALHSIEPVKSDAPAEPAASAAR